MKRISTGQIILLLLIPVLLLAQAENDKEVTIGFVVDGPNQNLKDLDQLMIKEIMDLTRGEFKINFPNEKRIVSDWTTAGINASLDKLLADDEVDIIITLGLLSSHEAAKRDGFRKPVIAPLIMDPTIQETPIKDGASGIKNFNYVSQFLDTRGIMKSLTEIFPTRTMGVIIQKSALQTVPHLKEKAVNVEKENHIKVKFLLAEESAEALLAEITDEIDAVYVSNLYRFSEAEITTLARGLIAKKIPSITAESRKEVEKGFCATFTPETSSQRLSRRVALNLQRILLGEEAGQLPVAFSEGQQMIINMKTLRQIGRFPSWSILFEAELINDEPLKIDREYTLNQVMHEAVEVNLDVLAALQKKIAGQEDITRAKTNFAPQIDSSLTGLIIDSDRAEASFGTQPETTLVGKLSITQLLFSEKALANVQIQRILQSTRELDLEKVKLDIALAAGQAYINVLRAKTIEEIRKNNLKVTRSNLELAKVRKAVGISGASDVYRWQAQLATAQNDVNNAQRDSNLARVQLNRILHRPLNEEFALSSISQDQQVLMVRENEVFKYTGNPITFAHFKNYLVKWGIENSTDIKSLDAAIEARQRILKSERASYYTPTIALQAAIEQRLAKGGKGTDGLELDFDLPIDLPLDLEFPLPDDTNWNVAIQASLPLFQGGERASNIRKYGEEITGLNLQRSSAMEKISQAICSAAQVAGTSYISIGLSQKAEMAAKKNLELVQDAYSRGVINIIDLLDAQNAALNAELLSAASTYTFAMELLNTERATGKFIAFMSAAEWQEWKTNLRTYFEKMGIKPENWQY